MKNSIRQFIRRHKGLEALQAVLLIGCAFLICTGLRSIWTKSEKTVETTTTSILQSSGSGSSSTPGS
ncbi:MAG: hypothetical protein K1X57_22995 [Gemmataceae bacterium]|nr:hypothetical protein [Gemmataceae bacterium]